MINENDYDYIFQYEFVQCVGETTNDSNATMPLTDLILGENFTSFTFFQTIMMKGLSWHVENMILMLNVIFYVIVGIVYSEAELTGKLVERS